jgi:hypothetical protein
MCRFTQPMEHYLLVGTYRAGSEKVKWFYPVTAKSPEIQRSFLLKLLNIFGMSSNATSPIAGYPFFED